MLSRFLSPRIQELAHQLREFVDQELVPLEQNAFHRPFQETEQALKALRPKVKAMGAWNLYLSKDHGGPGFSLLEVAQLSEILGRSPLGHLSCNCQAPDAGNIELLLSHASPALASQFLHPLLSGDIRSCFSMTEPDFAGSNPVNMGTTAIREGDEYVINGHKWFTSSADGASFAIVMAVTNPEAPKPHMRASMIIVPTDRPGFDLVRNIPVMGHAGSGYHSHAEIRYTNVRVPVTNRLGAEGAGFALAQERLGPGRIHHCMRWIGICERSFDLMCMRAATRDMGNGSYLGHKQTVQHWIAESRAEIDAARMLVLNAAETIDQAGSKAAAREISTIKFFAANVLQKVLDRAIQTHGALGITDDTMLSYWYREERGARIYDGPDEVHKSSLAKKILADYGMPRSTH
ncbi:MAG: acyl-CoA dehydrogenase family protein [Bacteroidia bacterium]|nr:acyl-CoA dehydrogenase family protein [Bacteroidia bacterium]